MLNNAYNVTTGDLPQHKGDRTADAANTREGSPAGNRPAPERLNVPPKDANALSRLTAVCEPNDLIRYMAHQFATSAGSCDHHLTIINAYFAGNPQAGATVLQVLEALDACCDCEAFFLLRMLTR